MDVRAQLIKTGRYLLDRQLAWGTSGNISARTDADRMIITASGTFMGELSADDLAEYEIATGAWRGGRKGSKETPFHLAIYRRRPDVQAILHASPFYTTLIACSKADIPSELFIETMYYLEDVAYVDYAHPGTSDLAEAIGSKAGSANVIIMKNHGVVVFDDSLREAQMRLETLEMACRMIVTARAANIPLEKIPKETVRSFLEESRYKPRKKPIVERDIN